MNAEALDRPRGRPRDPLIEDAILRAARHRFATDGYSRMTIGDVAADAGVTRPTVYRRWPTKRELVIDALDHTFRADQAANPPLDLDALSAKEAVIEAVRRLDPRAHNNAGLALIGNVLAEVSHNPELLELVRTHAVLPRQQLFVDTMRALQARGGIRSGLDLEVLLIMCIGSYSAAYLHTGGDSEDLPERVVDALWPAISGPATSA